ncbi:hypothetical protein PFISCL1PPCAC_7799, partial [Pristionchus fissidentatus]
GIFRNPIFPNFSKLFFRTAMRNVEIKASVENWDELIRRAKDASGTDGTLIEQVDVFFHSQNGRLKMRSLKTDGKESHELIWYSRNDQEGPKLSTYDKIEMDQKRCDEMTLLLRHSNGVRGEVRKARLLFLVGQTRVHCDQVEGLGQFAELEVVLNDDEPIERGEEIANELMKTLGIKDLITCAYIDLLQKKAAAGEA